MHREEFTGKRGMTMRGLLWPTPEGPMCTGCHQPLTGINMMAGGALNLKECPAQLGNEGLTS